MQQQSPGRCQLTDLVSQTRTARFRSAGCVFCCSLCAEAHGRKNNPAVQIVSSSLPQCFQLFYEARLVIITNWGFAIWLNPFGMLNPQVIVNLLQEPVPGMDRRRGGDWLTWIVHLC